jgi:hypothetical protein
MASRLQHMRSGYDEGGNTNDDDEDMDYFDEICEAPRIFKRARTESEEMCAIEEVELIQRFV